MANTTQPTQATPNAIASINDNVEIIDVGSPPMFCLSVVDFNIVENKVDCNSIVDNDDDVDVDEEAGDAEILEEDDKVSNDDDNDDDGDDFILSLSAVGLRVRIFVPVEVVPDVVDVVELDVTGIVDVVVVVVVVDDVVVVVVIVVEVVGVSVVVGLHVPGRAAQPEQN